MIFRGKGVQNPETRLWSVFEANRWAAEMKEAGKARPGLLKRRAFERTVYGPDGRPLCKVLVHDSGNTEQVFDDHQDAIARPDPVRLSFEELSVRVGSSTRTNPDPVQVATKILRKEPHGIRKG